MAKGKHRAEPAKIVWIYEMIWLKHWWRERHSKRNRSNPWILDPFVRILELVRR
jgi:hypothetical protein